MYIRKHLRTRTDTKSLAEAREFSTIQSVQNGAEVHTTSHSVTTEAVYLKVKQLGHEADKLPPLVEILRMNRAGNFLHRRTLWRA